MFFAKQLKRRRLGFLATCVGVVTALLPATLWCQAWVPPPGEGNLSLSYVNFRSGDHLFSSDEIDGLVSRGYVAEGNRWYLGDTFSHTVIAGLDYGLTRRLALSASLGYVGAKYVGRAPVDLTVDDGEYHADLQDAGAQLRFMLFSRPLVITPFIGFGSPASSYPNHGHAALGLGFAEYRAGLSVARLLAPWIPRAYLHGHFTYAVGEEVLDNRLRRSILDLEGGYLINRSLSVRVLGSYLHTAGGQDWLDLDNSTHGSGPESLGTALSASTYTRLGAGVILSLPWRFSVSATFVSTLRGANIEAGNFFILGTACFDYALVSPVGPWLGWAGHSSQFAASLRPRRNDTSMIGQTIAHFRILSKLGQGGVGTVWRAEDTLLGRHVALKFLTDAVGQSPAFRQRFIREAKAASILDHPGIATVFEAGESDGQAFIAFQLVDGQTLREKITSGRVNPIEALSIAVSAAEALAHAHSNHIVHRDITSRNIMLEENGRVIVVDFGLALAEEETRLTTAPAIMGTAAYMAPEVATGKNADRRTDLYGLGVVLYEMLTGELPFSGKRVDQLLYAAVHKKPTPPSQRCPGLSAEVDKVVLKLLAKNPDDRYGSSEELAAELRGLINSVEQIHQTETMVEEAPETVLFSVTSLRARLRGVPWRRLRRPGMILGSLLGIVVIATLALKTDLQHRILGQEPIVSSVAVLPLQNLSDNPSESNFLSHGISQALCTKLTQLTELRVTPWLTSRRYGDPEMSLREIADELGVEGLIVGTFREYGERIQASISLVDPVSGTQHWAEDYEEVRTDWLAIEGRIAVEAARRLLGHLTGREVATLELHPTNNTAAYLHYLRGVEELSKGTEEGAATALAWFENATTADPGLAEAYVGIGAVHSDRFFFGWAGGFANLRKAEENYSQARQLKPELIRARRGLIRVYWEFGKPKQCLEEGKTVAALEGQVVEKLLCRGEAYVLGGLADKAIPLFEEVLSLDPANESASWFVVISNAWSGHFEKAIQEGMDHFRRFGINAELHLWLGFSHQGMQNFDRARFHYLAALEGFADHSNVYVNLYVGLHFYGQGEVEKAREIWLQGAEVARNRLVAYPDNFRIRFQLAMYYSVLDDKEAYDEQVVWLRRSPDLPIYQSMIVLLAPAYSAQPDRWGIDLSEESLSPEAYDIVVETLIKVFKIAERAQSTEYDEYIRRYKNAGATLRQRY